MNAIGAFGWQVLYVIVMVIVSTVTLLGILTLYLHRRSIVLREKVSTTFVNSLCVTSILRAVVVAFRVTLRMSDHLNGYPLWLWTVASSATLMALNSVASINLSCLALDRYLAICHCLRYYSLMKETTSYLLVAASWVAPMLLYPPLAMVTVLGETNYTYSITLELVNRPYYLTTCVTFLLSAMVVVSCYVLITVELRRSRCEVLPEELVQNARRRAVLKSTVSTTKVTALFFFLTFPYILLLLVRDDPPEVLFRATLVGRGLHVALVFPVYIWNNALFKEELQDWLDSLWMRCRTLLLCVLPPRLASSLSGDHRLAAR